MKTRIIYTKFWYDNYISGLNHKEKLAFIYFFTNEKVTLCGIYEMPDKYIKLDLNLKQNELDKIKNKFQKDEKFLFIDGWIKINNHELYNKFEGEKNEIARQRELSLIPKKIIQYQYSSYRVSPILDTLNNHNHKSIINNQKEGDSKGGIIKEEKNKYLDFVFLTEDEYKKLIEGLGENKTKEMIKRLNNYIGSKGKKYKSHYYTILNWVGKDKKKTDWKDVKLEED